MEKTMPLMPYSMEKNLNIEEKKQYYNSLRNYCKNLSSQTRSTDVISIGQDLISTFYMKKFYDQMLDIQGIDNLPNEPFILLCSHSTAHDIFSMYIALEKLGLPVSVMVATDCLNPLSRLVFRTAKSVLLNRKDKVSCQESILKSSATLFSGTNFAIFGESTWNLHPIKPMQDIKIGASMIATITGFPVIPTVLEYVEKKDIFDRENEIYKKIVLRFGEPYEITPMDDLSIQTFEMQKKMEQMRKSIWIENHIDRTELSAIDSNIYLNHTYLKKFGVFGFTYHSEYEAQFLRSNDGKEIENEYCLNTFHEFVPGVTYKKRK